jgi:hypothetical protein
LLRVRKSIPSKPLSGGIFDDNLQKMIIGRAMIFDAASGVAGHSSAGIASGS